MELWVFMPSIIQRIMHVFVKFVESTKIIKNNIIKDSLIVYVDLIISKPILNFKHCFLTDFH